MNEESGIIEIEKLIEVAIADPLIKKRIEEVLKLSSFERRLVLNIWLEKLRRQNARPEMIQALTYLFDDIVADNTLKQINNTY